eukprot:TRINITY_DN7128_c0_g1_i2.p1 TRINITY_DN7128_c0_g1~~TRINITY_DN7128_c0_g1_i2.p1  ORF type:complete len:100 (-),score=35.96 TRINITY_DN7128_c0_g1_i2:316-615(-)
MTIKMKILILILVIFTAAFLVYYQFYNTQTVINENQLEIREGINFRFNISEEVLKEESILLFDKVKEKQLDFIPDLDGKHWKDSSSSFESNSTKSEGKE